MAREIASCLGLCLLTMAAGLAQVTVPMPAWGQSLTAAAVLLSAAEVAGAQALAASPLQARPLIVADAKGADRTLTALEASASLGLVGKDPPLPPLTMMVRVFATAADAKAGAALAGVYRMGSTGEPEPGPAWTQGRNDLGDPVLAKGVGASARPDPARVVILYRHLVCDITMEPRRGTSPLVTQAARAWVAKVKMLQPPGQGGPAVVTGPPKPGDTGPKPTPQPPTLTLTGPASSALIRPAGSGSSLGLNLRLTWQKAGTIVDTVGLLGAKAGSYGMQVDVNGNVYFQVYAPQVQSPLRDRNGWHLLLAQRPIPKGQPFTVSLNADGKTIAFEVADAAGTQKLSCSLAVPLVDVALYAGDFPGDNHLPAAYGVHKGMTGTVQVLYCGAARQALVR